MCNMRGFDFSKYRRFVFLIADIGCLVLSSILVWIALQVVPNGTITDISVNELMINTALYVLITLSALSVAGAYKPLWRYATMRDLLSCILGVMCGLIMMLFGKKETTGKHVGM